MKKNNTIGLLIFIVVLLLIVFCYLYVDRSFVYLMVKYDSHKYMNVLFIFSDQITKIIGYLLLVIFLISGLFLIVGKRLSKLNYNLILIIVSVALSQLMKDYLKHIFGRYWPDTFTHNNLSLVKNHAYGFNFMQGGSTLGSFPSGHAAYIMSFSVALWFAFPKLRVFSIILPILVIFAQATLYFHFISDLLAGSLVGFISAIMVVSLSKKYSNLKV